VFCKSFAHSQFFFEEPGGTFVLDEAVTRSYKKLEKKERVRVRVRVRGGDEFKIHRRNRKKCKVNSVAIKQIRV